MSVAAEATGHTGHRQWTGRRLRADGDTLTRSGKRVADGLEKPIAAIFARIGLPSAIADYRRFCAAFTYHLNG
jgi:hypothetical protein